MKPKINLKRTKIIISNQLKLKLTKIKLSRAQNPYAFPRPEHSLQFTEQIQTNAHGQLMHIYADIYSLKC